jgi:CDP-diacylglycerol--serine O-phosphatidyltransferase
MISKSLPSVFTVGNLFLGIISIILAFQGETQYAAITVIIGMLLDGLDGRVARMLNAQSEFGKELDSLSDVISFGVAPAFIMYVVALGDLGPLGWLVTAIFPICGALRLARFNVQAGTPGYFIGLPITAAGGVLATLALYHDFFPKYILVMGMLFLSFLMVSSVKYPSFKKGRIPKATYWIVPLMIVIVTVFSIKYPQHLPKLIFLPLVTYALYGIKKNVDRTARKAKKEAKELKKQEANS